MEPKNHAQEQEKLNEQPRQHDNIQNKSISSKSLSNIKQVVPSKICISTSLVCDQYDTSFHAPGALKLHKILHTGQKPFACSNCEKSFYQQGNLKLHNRTHSGEKPFKCSKCKKSFHGSSGLRHHQITHTRARPFACSGCERSFGYKIR